MRIGDERTIQSCEADFMIKAAAFSSCGIPVEGGARQLTAADGFLVRLRLSSRSPTVQPSVVHL